MVLATVACGGHASSSVYRPKPTAGCLRDKGYRVIRVVESKPVAANREGIGAVYAVVAKRKVAIVFYADQRSAIAESKAVRRRESVFVAAADPEDRAALRRYMRSASYRVRTAFVAWAGVGRSGALVLLPRRSRNALASCLHT